MFDDEPNYFLRGFVLLALGCAAYSGLNWFETVGSSFIESNAALQLASRIHLKYFLGGLLIILGLMSWVRALISVAAYINSFLMTLTLGFLVLCLITCVYLLIEYRPDLAFATVEQRRAERAKELETPKGTHSQAADTFRIYTAADGRTMRAKLLSFDGKRVKILREDGIEFTNSIELYSLDDRNYIAETAQSQKATQ